ncbi:hypothetical protein F4677DRAFT_463958 [Hypoxylon crocopeplum]|nr:hypothetical protein F4677DRAFT_463958 [Hypoxylon crocopeplum]
MSGSTRNMPNLGNLPRPLAPTAPEFIPRIPTAVKLSDGVLDATFVTRTIPDISPNASIIGLCTVPHHRAGPHDLGWHIADFLAFKSLLGSEAHHGSATWLAQCDVGALAQANPENYAHGKEHRLVHRSAAVSSLPDQRGESPDQIYVEYSAAKLMSYFRWMLQEGARNAKAKGLPLVIIVCGPTTLQQGIFFGQTDARHHLTSQEIRDLLADDIDVTFVTPALFSAGWQVNPYFCRSPAGKVRADRAEFLARQFGGVFAIELVRKFVEWECPLLDRGKIVARDPSEIRPGPIKYSKEQQDTIDALELKVYGALVGRLSAEHGDHSFDFDDTDDDWEKLVGPRRYKPLSDYEKEWANLEVGAPAAMDEGRVAFVRDAFGANRASQVSHIKHLVRESYEAWPYYWSGPIGNIARESFDKFLKNSSPDDFDCQEMFNIVEHRASITVLADMVVKYFGLTKPDGEPCRDWDQRWTHESKPKAGQPDPFEFICNYIPRPNAPPGMNFHNHSIAYARLEVPARYLSESLRRHPPGDDYKATADKISDFLKEIKTAQGELLLKDPELVQMGIDWLRAVDMPICLPDGFALPEVQTAPLGLLDLLPNSLEETLSNTDSEEGLRQLEVEQLELARQLVNAGPGEYKGIIKKLTVNCGVMDMLHDRDRKKKAEAQEESSGSEQRTEAEPSDAGTSSTQGTSEAPGGEPSLHTPRAAEGEGQTAYVPPHLRGLKKYRRDGTGRPQ